MKKKILLLVSITLVMLFSGCANTNPEPKTDYEKKQQMINVVNSLPEEFKNPTVEGGISAVGIAGYSKYGLEVMLPEAEIDAKAKLSGKIQAIVSQLQEKALRHVKIDEIDKLDKSFKQATREVIKKIPLSGTKRIDMFQAQNGTLYVLMVIQKRDISRYLSNMKDTYKRHMQEANLSRQTIDEGMKVLDEMMKELDEKTK